MAETVETIRVPAEEPAATLAVVRWLWLAIKPQKHWQPGSHNWRKTKDGDPIACRLFLGHYSNKRGRRMNELILGPGEKLILVEAQGRALFGWRKFLDDTGQSGVCCSVFRNLSPLLSSQLIKEACDIAWQRWPNARLYTYVNPTKVKSGNPGACFKYAGWKTCGSTKGGLLVLEILPPVTITP